MMKNAQRIVTGHKSSSMLPILGLEWRNIKTLRWPRMAAAEPLKKCNGYKHRSTSHLAPLMPFISYNQVALHILIGSLIFVRVRYSQG